MAPIIGPIVQALTQAVGLAGHLVHNLGTPAASVPGLLAGLPGGAPFGLPVPAINVPNPGGSLIPINAPAATPAPVATVPANIANVVSRKAGLSGYVGIQNIQAFRDLSPYIGWYSDYNPDTPTVGNVQGIPMLWGATGSPCAEAVNRQALFNKVIAKSTPKIMFGFYEPDCNCPDSSLMSPLIASSNWDNLLAPLGDKGTILGSPSMCKQYDETFLTPFGQSIDRYWDITSIHVNKPDLAGVIKDVEYYRKYGKPIWIQEFACVYDQDGFTACTNQTQINQFIYDAVAYFEAQPDVIAYGPSNGAGLGTVWPLTTSAGQLSATGITYYNVVKYLAGR